MPSIYLQRAAVVGILAFGSALAHAEAPATVAALAADKVEARPAPLTPARPAPTYHIQVGLEGEVFPAFANYASLLPVEERRWGTVAVTISNHTGAPLRNRVSVVVPGWSDEEIQVAEMGAGERRTFVFAPTFLPRFFSNHEIAAATALVTATDMGGRQTFVGTAPVRVRAAGDMFWGADFKYASFIAAWVTPHDPQVEAVLARAKEFMPGRRLPGYEPGKPMAAQEAMTRRQARAIYLAVQRAGVSYVKSSMTFGGNQGWSERVRTPRESLRSRSANCIDATVMFAALFENLGMQPVVVLVPGHSYVGVRLARGSSKYLYIETAMVGRAGFEAAVAAADRGLARYPASQLRVIKISDARAAGIYPLPLP